MNAQEVYESFDRIGKAPGQFVQMKAVKNKIKKNETFFFNKVDDQYIFSNDLLNYYKESFSPKQEEWFDIVYKEAEEKIGENFDYLLNKAYKRLIGQSKASLSSEFKIPDVWEASHPQVKKSIASFLAPILNEVTVYNRPFGQNYLDRLYSKYVEALSPHLVTDVTKTILTHDGHSIVFNHLRRLTKVSA